MRPPRLGGHGQPEPSPHAPPRPLPRLRSGAGGRAAGAGLTRVRAHETPLRHPALLPLFALWASATVLPYSLQRRDQGTVFSKRAQISLVLGARGASPRPQVVPGGNYGFSLLAVPMSRKQYSSPTRSVLSQSDK